MREHQKFFFFFMNKEKIVLRFSGRERERGINLKSATENDVVLGQLVKKRIIPREGWLKVRLHKTGSSDWSNRGYKHKQCALADRGISYYLLFRSLRSAR